MSQGYPEPGAPGGATPKIEDQSDAEMSQRAASADDASPEPEVPISLPAEYNGPPMAQVLAEIPQWVPLADNEDFPLPHWIGVSGTASDSLNNNTWDCIRRIEEPSTKTKNQWEREIKDTEVKVDHESVRRLPLSKSRGSSYGGRGGQDHFRWSDNRRNTSWSRISRSPSSRRRSGFSRSPSPRRGYNSSRSGSRRSRSPCHNQSGDSASRRRHDSSPTTFRGGRSPLRSPKRRPRSPRRSPSSIRGRSRSPLRSPKRRPRSPRRSPSSIRGRSRSPLRSPKRRPRSPRRSPSAIRGRSRSPSRLSRRRSRSRSSRRSRSRSVESRRNWSTKKSPPRSPVPKIKREMRSQSPRRRSPSRSPRRRSPKGGKRKAGRRRSPISSSSTSSNTPSPPSNRKISNIKREPKSPSSSEDIGKMKRQVKKEPLY